MKRLIIAALGLLTTASFAQPTDAASHALFEAIRTSTGDRSITKTAVADAYESLNAGKESIISGVTASGTNTYTASVGSRVTSYVKGQHFYIEIPNANTGASTLSLNGMAPKAIVNSSGVAVTANEIKATANLFYYNGTSFQLIGGGGGGGSSTYNGTSPTTLTVGGLPAGTNVTSYSYDALFQAMFAPYINPAFTSFSVNQSPSNFDTGTTLTGNRTFTWSINNNSGTVNFVDIYDITAGSALVVNTPNDGAQTVAINTVTLNADNAVQQWRVVAHDAGSGGASINSGTFTAQANFTYYYGPTATTPATSSAVKLLPFSGLVSSTQFVLNTGTAQSKFELIIPPGHSLLSVVDTDALNLNITSSFLPLGTVGVLDAGGTSRSSAQFEYNASGPYSSGAHHFTVTIN